MSGTALSTEYSSEQDRRSLPSGSRQSATVQEGGLTTKRPGDVVGVAGTVLYLERGGGYTAFYLCQNLHNCTLKRVGGTVCKL